jgi:hypothetical protein
VRECLALVKFGVPFDVAFSVSNNIRVAWLIMFGELEGGHFNWSSLRWDEK